MLAHRLRETLDALADDKDVLVVASSETVRRQTVPLGRSAPRAAVILVVTIALLDGDAREPIARGVTQYSADDIRRLARRHSRDIEATLGYTYGETVVHRDDLVLV